MLQEGEEKRKFARSNNNHPSPSRDPILIDHRVMPAGVVALTDPLRGGTMLIVPTGGKVVNQHQCPGGLCLIYKNPLPDDLP